jgi:putative phosphoesterase
MIISDIHGSASALEAALARFDALKPDLFFVLGDLLYHGPRNPLPGGHDPKRVAALLNERKDSIIAVRGNCDAEVDQLLIDFPCMADYALVVDCVDGVNKRLFLTHGHIYNEEKMPFALPAGSVVFSGHTHVARLTTDERGVTWCNPGSVSLPKPGGLFPGPSYAVYDSGKIEVRAL